MKALLLADIHSDVPGLKRILDSVERDYDLLICVGDITDFGPVTIAEEVIAALKCVGCFVFVVSGNCDPPGVTGVLVDNGISLEGERINIGGYALYGIGGGPSGLHKVSEEDIERILKSVAVDGGILVSHMPPRGGCDCVDGASQCGCSAEGGSGSVLKIIEEFKPMFVFCGHIHEGRGKSMIGETVVVNPGPAKDGYFALIDLESKSVELGVVKDEKGKTSKE